MRIQVCLTFTIFTLIQKISTEELDPLEAVVRFGLRASYQTIEISPGETFPPSAGRQVSTPTNVSIDCDNYGVVVRWLHPDPSPQVRFHGAIKAASEYRKSFKTADRWHNISDLLFQSSYNRYVVFVKAVANGTESPLANSETFTFNSFASATIKCFLDFPEVHLFLEDEELRIEFTNPLHLYRETPALRNLTNETLNYSFQLEGQPPSKGPVCENWVKDCSAGVKLSNHTGRYCISLEGNIGQRPLKPRRSCYTGDIRKYPPITVYLYPLLGVAATLLKFKPLQQSSPLMLEPEDPVYEMLLVPRELEPKETITYLEKMEDEERTTADKDQRSNVSEMTSTSEETELEDESSGDLGDGYNCEKWPKMEMSPGDLVDAYGTHRTLVDP
ncbi:hypothetical protein DNTS_030235 [Danionella cerebrum]|uniref:Fibronectin type-III domain-containing protein n=1 Tax=Danionella cerebrum TaxID=2873325 RepID=A0A553Q8D1_9TELE|nr:hypothetical protein DNTS_030235 [Danionella translucida]